MIRSLKWWMVVAVVWLFNFPSVFAQQQTPTEIIEAARRELACDGCQQRVYGEIRIADAPVKKFTMAGRVHLEEEAVEVAWEDVRVRFSTPEQAEGMEKPAAGVEYIAHTSSSFKPPLQKMWDPIKASPRGVEPDPYKPVLTTEINYFSLTPWADIVGVDENLLQTTGDTCKQSGKAKYLWRKEREEIKGEPCKTYLRPLSLWVKEMVPGRWVISKMVLHERAGDRILEYSEYQLRNGYYRPDFFRVTGPQGIKNEIQFLCWEIEKDSFDSSVLANSSLGKTDIPMPVCEKTDTLTKR